MQKVFIVGGAGKIGRRLGRLLAERGDAVRALHRDPEQSPALLESGVEPVLGDLSSLSVDRITSLLSGSDVVVFSAGAGGKGGPARTNLIDGEGLRRCVDASIAAGVLRFILVSAFPEANRGAFVSETFENYMSVKKAADVYLAETDLDWIILRPAKLTDEPGTGCIRAGLAIPYGEVSRDDVALTLAELVGSDQLRRTIIELTEGSTAVSDAIKALQ